MKFETKVNRALNIMPQEIIVQYSSATDNINVLYENALNEAQEENKTVLEIFLTYAKETLETYDNELMRHINYEMKTDDPSIWSKERNEIKRYISKLEKYIQGE